MSTFMTVLKNKSKVTEAVGSASLKGMRTQIQEGPMSDLEGLLLSWVEEVQPSQHHGDQGQSKEFACDVEREGRSHYYW
jgi:hypothetical protein